MSLLSAIFGQYTHQVLIQSMLYIEIISCAAFFCYKLPRRSKFWLRAILWVVLEFAIVIGLSIFRYYYNNIYTRIGVYYLIDILVLASMMACFSLGKGNCLLLWCVIVATKEASSQIYQLTQLACGLDDQATIFFVADSSTNPTWYYFLGNWLVHLALFFVFSLIFNRTELKDQDRELVHKSIWISVTSVGLIVAFSSVIRDYQKESLTLAWVGKALCLAISLYVLIVYRTIVQENDARIEAEVMGQIVHEESKRFDNIKSNIEMINMKTHDLKHRLEQFEGKLTDEEISSMQQAIKIYDTNVKTGNEILDTILYEEQLLLEKEKVTLTSMADGKAVSFVSAAHLYSIFNNAFGNALEALEKVDDPAKKIIDLTVKRESGLVVIEMSNYCAISGNWEQGHPTTTKANSAQHGYGLKSIAYIASQYQGAVTTSIDKDVFTLRIKLTPPDVASNTETAILPSPSK